MKGFISLRLDDETLLAHEPNDLYRFEVDRTFRVLVAGTSPAHSMGLDAFFRGKNLLNVLTGLFPLNSYQAQYTALGSLAVSTETTPRHRIRLSATMTAPNPPSQRAHPVGRLYTYNTITSPNGLASSVDVALRQVGSVFGHAAGRRAFFNESGVGVNATGFGVVTPVGPTLFLPSEEGHYIYDVRIVVGGATGVASYVFRRRPWVAGAYEPGAGQQDAYISSSSDTPETRFVMTGATNRTHINLVSLIPAIVSPTPSGVAYHLNYPTAAAASTGTVQHITGMVFDGLVGGRIWWVVCDKFASNHANASTSRSIWAWKRMSSESFTRMDTTLSSFPSLGAGVQYRDCKTGRNGRVYVAADGSDDSNNGTDVGALLVINADTLAVTHVVGSSVTGIYTVGGLPQNNIVGITVDTSDASVDRIWALTRAGMAYADMNITTGVLSAWTNVTASIDTASRRGLGGFTFPANSGAGAINRHPATIDCDSDGNVYWQSVISGGGIARLNKVDRPGTTHTYLSLDSATEGGAAGRLDIGIDFATPAATSRMISSIKVHRRDPGDPLPDDIWLGAGRGASTTTRMIVCLPVDQFTGTDPGFYWGTGAVLTNDTQNVASFVHVAPDGTVWWHTSDGGGGTRRMALLESEGRKVTVSGTGATKSFGTPSGSTQTITDTAATFTSAMVGRPFFSRGAANAGNNGRFKIITFNSATSIDITNSAGVLESSVASSWAIDNFDSDPTTAGSGQGTWNPGAVSDVAQHMFCDDSGIMYPWAPMTNGGANTMGDHCLSCYTPISYQWDSVGSRWYRARFPAKNVASAKTTHVASELLSIPAAANNVFATFGDGVGGPPYFVLDEYYTFVGTSGAAKTATQQLTVSYDLYLDKTEEVLGEMLTNKVAVHPTTQGGSVAQLSTPANVAYTTNPFTGSAALLRGLAHYQRQLLLNGSNNTPTSTITAGATATPGVIGIDLGSAMSISALRFAFSGATALHWTTMQMDIYSARQLTQSTGTGDAITAPVANVQTLTDAGAAFSALDIGRTITIAGGIAANNGTFPITAVLSGTQISYTNATGVVEAGFTGTWAVNPWYHRSPTIPTQYQTEADCPAWTISGNAAHQSSSVTFGAAILNLAEVGIDLVALGLNALSNERYWKVNISTGTNTSYHFAGIVAFDTSGVLVGAAAGKFLGAADDTNFLACMPARLTWLQDSGTGTASRHASITNRVTLAADAFDLAVTGTGDSFSLPGGSTVRLTDAAGLFTAAMVGRYVVISGATSAANNGAFLITAQAGTTLDFTNAAGVAEAFAGTWSVDGVVALDYFRHFLTSTGTSMSVQTLGAVTLTVGSATFDPTDVGRFIRISSSTFPATNDGFFRIIRYVSSTVVLIQNPAGVAETSSFTWRLIREARITTVDSNVQLTLASSLPLFTSQDWEVVRNTDVRPRDDEGASENVARFPIIGGEIDLDAVTGHVVYADNDVMRSRVLRAERYVKVKRSL